MKTDPIEIFQTIRAALQPYETLGFSNRINSEDLYDLWSDKNIDTKDGRRTETFFASVSISNHEVLFKTGNVLEGTGSITDLKVDSLDDILINKIEDSLATGYKIYKEREWV